MSEQIPKWKMIREAVKENNNRATYKEIREYIHQKWDNVNDNTITGQLIRCTVNQQSRTHHKSNQRERVCDEEYDCLFRVGKAEVMIYDSTIHGTWEIALINEKYLARPVEEIGEEEMDDYYSFAYENHLRDFLGRNITSLDPELSIYIDEQGREGIEYKLPNRWRIDLLCKRGEEEIVIIEIKKDKAADKAVGQIQAYMGWIREHLQNFKKVTGIVVSYDFNERLEYAIKENPNLSLFTYKLLFEVEKQL